LEEKRREENVKKVQSWSILEVKSDLQTHSEGTMVYSGTSKQKTLCPPLNLKNPEISTSAITLAEEGPHNGIN
jgi:hypothetical protein